MFLLFVITKLSSDKTVVILLVCIERCCAAEV